MPATDLSSRGAFARLARAFVEIGAAEHLPVLPKVGASDLDSAVALASAAVAEGVPPEVFEKLLAWRADQNLRAAGTAAAGPGPLVPAGGTPSPPATVMIPTHLSLVPAGGQESRPATVMIPTSAADRPRGDGPALPEEAASRPDIPIRRDVRRASKRAAIEAALDENRDAALADIDGNILARSSQAPFQSRVRTWTDVCHAWAQEPWPITAEKLRMVAASFRRGGYRSVQNYFDSATTYQEHFLGIVVEPLLRKAMRRYTRAVTRGLPGARLKAIFPFDLLAKLAAVSEPAHLEPWSPWNSAHAVDAMILAVWFMLREIEFAAARTQDIDVLPGAVALRIPLHKVATGGETELTERRLQCACRASVLPLCPYHAARRHVDRLKAAGAWARGKPLFPDGAGRTWARGEVVLFFRRVLLAAGVALTTTDHTGAVVQIYARHLCRVAGAAWLAGRAVPTPVIQLLGRWSSTAVERYVQAAPLVLAPAVPGRVLSQEPPQDFESGIREAASQAAAGPAPRAILDGRPGEEQPEGRRAPVDEAFSPVLAFAPAPARGDAAEPADQADHFIFNSRGRRLHATDLAEATTEKFLWKARGCGWPYGIRSFYRVTQAPGGRPGAFGVFPTGVKRRHRVRQRRRRPRPLLPARDPPTLSRRRARPADEKLFAHPFGLRRLPASLHRRAGTSSFCSALSASSHPCTRPSPAWPGSPWHRPP